MMTYTLMGGTVIQNGAQVGLFAVRPRREGELGQSIRSGAVLLPRPWIIDHWPSGSSVLSFDELDAAWVVADELSLQADERAEAKDFLVACQSVPVPVLAWAMEVAWGQTKLRFRDWRAV